MRLGDVQRRHVQLLADKLVGEGKSASTVRNALLPLRVIYRRAIRDGLAVINPRSGVDLPANRSARVAIVSIEHAADLIAALGTERDRALGATAFYAGLRAGELMALRWVDVDLAAGELHVDRSYDSKVRSCIEPNARAGRRRVPIAGVLRTHLRALALVSNRADPEALAFGDHSDVPFGYDSMKVRARRDWKTAGLAPIRLHAARHTAASVMIASRINLKSLSEFMGHSGIATTIGRYGHLMPGGIQEAAGLLDSYLERPERVELANCWRTALKIPAPEDSREVSKTVGRGFESFRPC
jgi:integrase